MITSLLPVQLWNCTVWWTLQRSAAEWGCMGTSSCNKTPILTRLRFLNSRGNSFWWPHVKLTAGPGSKPAPCGWWSTHRWTKKCHSYQALDLTKQCDASGDRDLLGSPVDSLVCLNKHFDGVTVKGRKGNGERNVTNTSSKTVSGQNTHTNVNTATIPVVTRSCAAKIK